MKGATAYFYLLLALFLGVATPANAQGLGNFVLGFADCEPAIFTKLAAVVTVKMTNFTYASTNRLNGFRQEVIDAAGQHLVVTVKIDEKRWNGRCDSLAFTAEAANSRQSSPAYNSFAASDVRGMVAFSPGDPGGVVLGDSPEGSVTTRFKYGASGRRLLSTQSFLLRGKSYVITYSEYNYGPVHLGKLGTITNLLGYTASLAVKE